MMKKYKVKDHIMSFIKSRVAMGSRCFYTHEIQRLSEQGLMTFGRRLGSYGTYTRMFRQLREDGYLSVRKIDNPKSREARWEVRGEYV